MVKGLDTFQKYFADYEEQYVLISQWKRSEKRPFCFKTRIYHSF